MSMRGDSEQSSDEVWLSSAEVRVWLEISPYELDDLVTRGVLTPQPLRHEALQPIFSGADVSKLAAERRKRVTA
jgi:hypothetical protein